MAKRLANEAIEALKKAGFAVNHSKLIIDAMKHGNNHTIMVSNGMVNSLAIDAVLAAYGYNRNGYPLSK